MSEIILAVSHFIGQVIGTVLGVILIAIYCIIVLIFIVKGVFGALFILASTASNSTSSTSNGSDPIFADEEEFNDDHLKPCVDVYRSIHPYSYNPYDRDRPWGEWSD